MPATISNGKIAGSKVGCEKLLGTESDGKISGCKVGWKDCWDQSWIGRSPAGKLDGKNAGSIVRWEDCWQESQMGRIDVSKVGWEGLPAANSDGKIAGSKVMGRLPTAESDGKDYRQQSRIGNIAGRKVG